VPVALLRAPAAFAEDLQPLLSPNRSSSTPRRPKINFTAEIAENIPFITASNQAKIGLAIGVRQDVAVKPAPLVSAQNICALGMEGGDETEE